ncbi:hypothetical protein HKX48_005936 [Thoreauomyces humboldtii]|nr:hypothetical protein HKX48_005936 [Thoreauomyces humboldtii]
MSTSTQGDLSTGKDQAECLVVDPLSFRFSSDLSLGAPLSFASPHSHPPTPTYHADVTAIQRAASLLSQDQVVAFPSETVYGLAANALHPEAVAKIFHAKGRPSDNPLIVHVSSLAMLRSILPTSCQSPPEAYAAVVAASWPGPLTILIPRGPSIPLSVTAGHETVAVRFPSHPIARALIDACGFPLAAPSANTSGRPSPTLAEHVLRDLGGRIPLIIDGGPCGHGVESTVLDALAVPPVVLRPGGVTVEMLRDLPGMEGLRVYGKKDGHVDDKDAKAMEAAPTTPGMKYRHYTPEAEVLLFEPASGSVTDRTALRAAVDSEARHLLTTMASTQTIGILRTTVAPGSPSSGMVDPRIHEMHLGRTSAKVAQELFKALRSMEQRGVTIILVEGVSEDGEGLAVMNRLRKAASSTRVVS